MRFSRHSSAVWIVLCAACVGVTFVAAPDSASAAALEIQQAPAQAPVAKQVGVAKSINGNALTLTTDSGADVAVQIVSSAKMVRVAPGQTDLKSATPIQLADLQ